MLENIEIPYGVYWSTPFAKWQGSLQRLHAMRFAAYVAKRELAARDIDPATFDSGVFGMTNSQYQSFYGAPWPLYDIGATQTPGHMITQVCATGARVLFAAASEIATGLSRNVIVMAADRLSNGPHIYYPDPKGPGGYGVSEDQVPYNMGNDAIGGHSMLQTGENVVRKYGFSREEQDAVVLRRYKQYQDALADDRAFHKRFMTLPFSVPKPNFKSEDTVLEGDEGIFPTTAEGLARLKPILPDGIITFGGQTHPADANAGVVVTTADRARELSRDPSVCIRFKAFAQDRVDMAMMPEAPVKAARKVLDHADVRLDDIAVVKSHNPFAVNDLVFSRETGRDLADMNNYGCSLIWGHSNATTAVRAILELIEELHLRGGGLGLFQGCAAGDTSMAVVIEVTNR